MVPIHDSDIAETRWSQAKWERFELWEKIESRLRRKRRAWIGGTAVAFVLLAAIPVLRDRAPKWTSLTAIRRLASEINALKREAMAQRAAYRIRFKGEGSLGYAVERSRSCAEPAFEPVREGNLLPGEGDQRLVGPSDGIRLSLPNLAEELCFDYLSGNHAVIRNRPVFGFGVAPARDLTEPRTDRVSLLVVSGPSAELTFE
jgi:hypothetical protein